MDGVRYQIEQLQCALGQLDLHRMLPQWDAAQLQLSLANTTAVALRVMERQSRRTFPKRLAGVSVDSNGRPDLHAAKGSTNNNNNNNNNNSSSSSVREAQQRQIHQRECDMPAAGGKGRNTAEVWGLQGNREWADECRCETILSVATHHGLSVQEVRRYNPQLSAYDDRDILPINTYIKMKPQISQQIYYGLDSNETSAEHSRELQLNIKEATPEEFPAPLAPLPIIQETHRDHTTMKMTMAGKEKGPTLRRMPFKGAEDSPKEQLMQLPSPSPDRVYLLQKNRNLGECGTKDDFSERNCPGEISTLQMMNITNAPFPFLSPSPSPSPLTAASVPFTDNVVAAPPASSKVAVSDLKSTEMNTMGYEANLENVVSGTKTSKPSLAQHSTITALLPNNDAFLQRTSSMVQASDQGHSFVTESSSFHSTPMPTPNMSPQRKNAGYQMGTEEVRRGAPGDASLVPPPLSAESLKAVAKTSTEASLLDDNDDIPHGNEERSPIPKSPLISHERADEFDTLNSIALQYDVTVKDVLQWNPYLVSYEADEPLPPNFPILLPIQQQE